MPAEQAGFMGQQRGYIIMIDYAGLGLHDSVQDCGLIGLV